MNYKTTDVDGVHHQALLNYRNLARDFERFEVMTDTEFVEALPEVLHHACIVVALKGSGKAAVLDYGVIHMLVHCLPGSKSAEMTDEYLGLTRRTYGRECRLSP